MLRRELHRIDHAQHLVEVAARRHGIDENELDLLVGANDEHVADGLIVSRGSRLGVAGGGSRQHAVELGNLEVGIADHWIIRGKALRVLDVVGPFRMVVHGIDAQADDLDPALVELGLDPRHVAELGGADRREVLGMREQHGPGIADPLVKADAALRGIGLEVGCGFAKLECHVASPYSLAGFAPPRLRYLGYAVRSANRSALRTLYSL